LVSNIKKKLNNNYFNIFLNKRYFKKITFHYYNAGLAKSCYTALKIPSSTHPRASSITTTPSLKQHLHRVKPPLTQGSLLGAILTLLASELANVRGQVFGILSLRVRAWKTMKLNGN